MLPIFYILIMARKSDEIKDFYDRSYKKLFSYKGFVKQLLQGFVRLKWVERVDFDKITLEPVSFIDRLFKKKEADIIWKLPLKQGSEVYLYLLLEFQSAVDKTMALRFASYILNFYAERIAKEKNKRLPVVFPLLLYNGKLRWNAAKSLQEMIELVDPSLREYLIRFKYFAIDIGSFSKRSLIKLRNNLVSAIFLLENARNENELDSVLKEIVEIVKSEMDKELLARFGDWFEMLFKRTTKTEVNFEEIISEGSEYTMIVETLIEMRKKWENKGIQKGFLDGKQIGRQEGLQEGRQKGRQEAIVDTAIELLKEGSSVEFVAKVTKLSIREIEKLKQNIG